MQWSVEGCQYNGGSPLEQHEYEQAPGFGPGLRCARRTTMSLTVTGTASLGNSPGTACIDSSDAYVYVSNANANTVDQIRISDMTVTGTCSLGITHAPIGICIDSADAYVYVACNNANTVEQIRISDMTVVGTASLGASHSPMGVCIDSADTYVYVANYNAQTVDQIRISDMTVTGTCSLGATHGPRSICIDSANTYVYVGNYLANTVEQIRISDMTVTGTCSLGATHGPMGVCIDSTDAYVYVANYTANTVDQIYVSLGPIWVSPADTAAATPGDSLVWTSVAATKRAHFKLQIASDSGFSSGLSTYYSYADSGFEYWDGSAWQALGAAGMPSNKTGNNVRYTATSGLSGTKYRRVAQTV